MQLKVNIFSQIIIYQADPNYINTSFVHQANVSRNPGGLGF